MKYIFAHAEETHDDVVEAVSHSAGVDPLLLLLGGIVLSAIVAVGVQLVLKKPNLTIFTALALLFVIGVFAYSISLIVSVLAIAMGFILSLALAFGGISSTK